MSGSQPAGNQTLACYPVAVLGMSSVPSVLCLGDSRTQGYTDTATSNVGLGDMGEICRSIGQFLPYTNVGCQSDCAATFVTSHAYRAALQAYHTHVHVEYGINDIYILSAPAGTVETHLTSIYGYFPTKRVTQSTITPESTSTDSWATVANQTTKGSDSVRTTVNTWIRTLPSPLYAYFDVTSVIEDPTKTGCFKGTDSVPLGTITAAVTNEGIHENPYGASIIQKSGIINPAVFT
jgi:hypothetical protein